MLVLFLFSFPVSHEFQGRSVGVDTQGVSTLFWFGARGIVFL